MITESAIQEILANSTLTVSGKAEEVSRTLARSPGYGAADAIDILRKTRDPRVASFAANHLALFSNFLPEKNEIVSDILDHRREVMAAATNLVRFLEPAAVERIVAEYLQEPGGELYNLAYEVAAWFPARLRKHFDQVTDALLRLGLLSGGPENWAEAIAQRYRASPQIEALESLGRMHTRGAAAKLRELSPQVLADHREPWRAALNNCGQSEPGEDKLVSQPAMMGFVVERGHASHQFGGPSEGPVPLCMNCNKPAYLVVRLHTPDLPFGAGLATDLEFFWFSCHCAATPYVNIQGFGAGRKVLIGPHGPADSQVTLLPVEASLELVKHPNQFGISLDAGAGLGRHQVGGFPQWMRPVPFPVCLLCEKPMHFIAQIDNGMTLFGRLNFKGILFCFWCQDCNCATTFQQKM